MLDRKRSVRGRSHGRHRRRSSSSAGCLPRAAVRFILLRVLHTTSILVGGRLKEPALLGEPCCGTPTCTVLCVLMCMLSSRYGSGNNYSRRRCADTGAKPAVYYCLGSTPVRSSIVRTPAYSYNSRVHSATAVRRALLTPVAAVYVPSHTLMCTHVYNTRTACVHIS